MFLGQFEHTIDEKGRMTIPARFREQLENGAYITRGFDGNLAVYTALHFEQMYEKINQMSITDPAARQLGRLIFSTAYQLEFDKAGRILLPQFLRENAGFTGSATVVGVGDHFELWVPEQWAREMEKLNDTEANEKRFSALTL